MLLDVICTNSGILMIIKILKNIFTLVQIIGPILALIALCIQISKIVTTNDISNIKKYNKNINNSLIALALLFLLPFFVNITMSIIGEKTTISSCWNSIDTVSLKSSGKYIEKKDNKTKTKVCSARTTSKISRAWNRRSSARKRGFSLPKVTNLWASFWENSNAFCWQPPATGCQPGAAYLPPVLRPSPPMSLNAPACSRLRRMCWPYSAYRRTAPRYRLQPPQTWYWHLMTYRTPEIWVP